MYMLECCIDSVESALAAQEGGANRLELCANLLIGGTTPDPNLYRAVRKKTNLTINALLRPRFGDFCYTDLEFDILCADVEQFRDLGADGIVIGILRPDGALDTERMKRLIDLAGGMHITLHRAFDVCRDPFEALEQARELGVHTILTSGQCNSAMEGRALLRQLVERAGEMEILVGSGVTPENIQILLKETGARAFHMSGKVTLDSEMQYRKETVSMGLPMMSEYAVWRTSAQAVAQVRRCLDETEQGA